MNEGTWEQMHVISEVWTRESTQLRFKAISNGWEEGYGYQWWLKTFHTGLHNYKSYFAEGWGGQCIFVFPDIEMIVVFTGGNYYTSSPMIDLMNSFILPAVY